MTTIVELAVFVVLMLVPFVIAFVFVPGSFRLSNGHSLAWSFYLLMLLSTFGALYRRHRLLTTRAKQGAAKTIQQFAAEYFPKDEAHQWAARKVAELLAIALEQEPSQVTFLPGDKLVEDLDVTAPPYTSLAAEIAATAAVSFDSRDMKNVHTVSDLVTALARRYENRAR